MNQAITINKNTDKLSPLVSVIVPAYNHEDYIAEAIQSIWGQSYKNVEIIAIDDGSTDGTYEKLVHLERLSPIKMRVLTQKNSGICSTLNRGLSIASGYLVSFLASDDRYVATRIEDHVRLLSANHQNVSLFGCCGQLAAISKYSVRLKTTKNTLNRNLPAPTLDRALRCKLYVSLQACTFYTEKAREISFDETLYFEDWDFFIRALRKYDLLTIDRLAVEYRVLPESASKNITSMITARHHLYRKYVESELLSTRETNLLQHTVIMQNSKSHYNLGSNAAAVSLVFTAARLNLVLTVLDYKYLLSLSKRFFRELMTRRVQTEK
jgi:alpha-1,3-rhamnosyltransferase